MQTLAVTTRTASIMSLSSKKAAPADLPRFRNLPRCLLLGIFIAGLGLFRRRKAA